MDFPDAPRAYYYFVWIRDDDGAVILEDEFLTEKIKRWFGW
jgi:hypothetical protein